jgi:hypothetical protein
MDLTRITAFMHIFFSILLMGLALYWMIMVTALKKRYGADETARLLQVANHARWPHVIVPPARRIPLPWITWLTIAALIATGIASVLLGGAPGGALRWIKLTLVVAIICIQVLLTKQPRSRPVRINFALVIAVILVSGLALR